MSIKYCNAALRKLAHTIIYNNNNNTSLFDFLWDAPSVSREVFPAISWPALIIYELYND